MSHLASHICSFNVSTPLLQLLTSGMNSGKLTYLLTLLYLSSCTILGRKSFLSAASLKAWVGGMLWAFSVSFTPLIQVFLGLPLALYSDIFVHLCVVSCTGKLMRCHACQVPKPSDSLLLDVVENWCSNHFSYLGVLDLIASGFVDGSP